MEDSVLISTKKILGLSENYTPFDLDVITYINSAFTTLEQLGVGSLAGFHVEDESLLWTHLMLPRKQLNMVKTYVNLKVRMLFDPPTTSYLIDAMNEQIQEHEWRLTNFREEDQPV